MEEKEGTGMSKAKAERISPCFVTLVFGFGVAAARMAYIGALAWTLLGPVEQWKVDRGSGRTYEWSRIG